MVGSFPMRPERNEQKVRWRNEKNCRRIAIQQWNRSKLQKTLFETIMKTPDVRCNPQEA